LATLAVTDGHLFSVRGLPSEDPAQRQTEYYAELGVLAIGKRNAPPNWGFTAMQSNEMKYRLDTIKGLNKVKESNVVANFLLNLATLGLFNHFGGNIQDKVYEHIDPKNISTVFFNAKNTNNCAIGIYKVQGYTSTIK